MEYDYESKYLYWLLLTKGTEMTLSDMHTDYKYILQVFRREIN